MTNLHKSHSTQQIFKDQKPISDIEKVQILENHRGLVYQRALSYSNKYHMPLDDLVSVGNLALLKCINSYTPDKATKFNTYAYTAVW